MYLDIAALTHIGRRANNEDAFLVDPAHELCVVADGMGGYEGGEVAARIAVRTIGAVVARLGGGDNVAWPGPIDPRRSSAEQELEVATRLAGEAIAAEKRGALADMGRLASVMRDPSKNVPLRLPRSTTTWPP